MGRVFSGIQPTGQIHIGNYLGAIRNWVTLQDTYESLFCVVDYHAITIPYEASELPERVRRTAAAIIASGVDPGRCTLFIQSHVPEHLELNWIFACLTPLGWLERMTQFKEKSRQHEENIRAGLLNYPILQAADILLYKADLIPVGEDQVQHVELTRDIGRTFNHAFGETFPEAKPLLTESARVMALNSPTQKMSKSVPGSFIGLMDEPDEIRLKIRRAVTDAGPQTGEMGPGVKNLFTLLESFADEATIRHFHDDFAAGTLRYSDLKQALGDAIVDHFAPIRDRAAELLSNSGELDELLRAGAEKATRSARTVLSEVRERAGLGNHSRG